MNTTGAGYGKLANRTRLSITGIVLPVRFVPRRTLHQDKRARDPFG